MKKHIKESRYEIPESILLTHEQEKELDIRLENHYKHPEVSIKWEDFKKELLK